QQFAVTALAQAAIAEGDPVRLAFDDALAVARGKKKEPPLVQPLADAPYDQGLIIGNEVKEHAPAHDGVKALAEEIGALRRLAQYGRPWEVLPTAHHYLPRAVDPVDLKAHVGKDPGDRQAGSSPQVEHLCPGREHIRKAGGFRGADLLAARLLVP